MIYLSSGEPNRSERNRDRSYYVLVYHRIAEQKVIKCVLVSQRGNHSKIHHTEEDSGKLLVSLNSYKLNLVIG
ncbi:unnamed protein product [Brassica rapa subsp. narinosa]